jgi:pimeloyl-ACP methyl ester carboxylesterase
VSDAGRPSLPDVAPAPVDDADPESFIVRLDTGERIHYLDWGQPPARELPPLLLVHGVAQTGWIWAPVARRLRSLTRVLAPDLRGHGLSDAPRSGYDLDSLAMDMLTVLTANGWGQDAGGQATVVAGHGFGAAVAATMAGVAPRSVGAVALVDGGWEEMGQATGLTAAEFLAGLAEPPEVLRSMDAFLSDRRDFDPDTWDADQERAARAQVDQKHAGHVGLVARPGAVRGVVDAMFEYRPEEALTRFPAPVLVLVAEAATADDEGARERDLALEDVVRARAAAGIGAPHVVRFRGAGHNLMRYRASEVTSELLARLRGAPTSAHTRDGPA